MIQKCLSVSTAHITKEDCLLLEQEAEHPYNQQKILFVYDYGIGFLILLNKEPFHLRELRIKKLRKLYSEAFCRLLVLATQAEADMLRLDPSMETIAEFQTFDWSTD